MIHFGMTIQKGYTGDFQCVQYRKVKDFKDFITDSSISITDIKPAV